MTRRTLYPAPTDASFKWWEEVLRILKRVRLIIQSEHPRCQFSSFLFFYFCVFCVQSSTAGGRAGVAGGFYD